MKKIIYIPVESDGTMRAADGFFRKSQAEKTAEVMVNNAVARYPDARRGEFFDRLIWTGKKSDPMRVVDVVPVMVDVTAWALTYRWYRDTPTQVELFTNEDDARKQLAHLSESGAIDCAISESFIQ